MATTGRAVPRRYTAAEMQCVLLPPLAGHASAAPIAGVVEPASTTCGDSFDDAINGHMSDFVVTDAVGHGMAAVLKSMAADHDLSHVRREHGTLEAAYSEIAADGPRRHRARSTDDDAPSRRPRARLHGRGHRASRRRISVATACPAADLLLRPILDELAGPRRYAGSPAQFSTRVMASSPTTPLMPATAGHDRVRLVPARFARSPRRTAAPGRTDL